jgi:hypothetical protein
MEGTFMSELSAGVQFAWQRAAYDARQKGHQAIAPGQLLAVLCRLAMARVEEDLRTLGAPREWIPPLLAECHALAPLFTRFDIPCASLAGELTDAAGAGSASGPPPVKMHRSEAARAAFSQAAEWAGRGTIRLRHLLAGLLAVNSPEIVEILKKWNVNAAALQSAALGILTLRLRVGDSAAITFRTPVGEIILGDPNPQPDCSGEFSLPETSDLRARLFWELGTWWVQDMDNPPVTLRNGAPVAGPESLSPGDTLQCGDISLRVSFEARDLDPGPGTVDAALPASEALPGADVPEDTRLEVLAGVAEIAAHFQSQQARLDGFLREVGRAFPRAQRRTILLIEDEELVPRAFFPPDRSHASFSLARKAIRQQQAFHWRQADGGEGRSATSLAGVASALYAPIFSNGRVIGVVHLDTADPDVEFGSREVALLGVMATTMGGAIMAGGGERLPPLPSAFLSYSHLDDAFTHKLARDLRREQVKTWLDERLKSGCDWREQVELAIGQTTALVHVMSPDSLRSEPVRWELDTARRKGKPVLPILCRAMPPQEIGSAHCIPFHLDYDAGLAQLVRELRAQGEQNP